MSHCLENMIFCGEFGLSIDNKGSSEYSSRALTKDLARCIVRCEGTLTELVPVAEAGEEAP